MATTPEINTNRLNMVTPAPRPLSYGPKSGIFKPRGSGYPVPRPQTQ
jgi:hypothetical protein